jgi:hypothetical protein
MKSPQKLSAAIETVLSEWLSTYVLLGYDEDGNEVVCSNINGQRDMDALMTFIMKTANEMQSSYDTSEEEFIHELEEDDED